MIYSKLYDLLATQAWHKNPTRSNPLETSTTQQKTDKRLPVCFLLAAGYKKDIFGIIAYEFGLTSECVIS